MFKVDLLKMSRVVRGREGQVALEMGQGDWRGHGAMAEEHQISYMQ